MEYSGSSRTIMGPYRELLKVGIQNKALPALLKIREDQNAETDIYLVAHCLVRVGHVFCGRKLDAKWVACLGRPERDTLFPPIFDQGSIGSCDWFAVVYYQMTFLYNKQCNRAAALENTFSPQFGYNILNNAGSFPINIRVDDVYKFVKKHGSATMLEFPYNQQYLPWCTDATVWQHALSSRIDDYHFLPIAMRRLKPIIHLTSTPTIFMRSSAC